jgi:DNA polymerase III epsilon subunit-like protein
MNIQPLSLDEYAVSELHVKDLMNRRFCVFDCERTGPHPDEDRIIQFGAVLAVSTRG